MRFFSVLLTCLCFLFSFSTFAQLQGSGKYKDFLDLNFSPSFDLVHLSVDLSSEVSAYKKEDVLSDSLGGYPFRFGITSNQNIALNTLSSISFEKNGDFHTVYGIAVPSAQSINIGLSNLNFETNERMYIQNKSGSHFLGPFVSADFYKGHLGSELLFVDTVYIHFVQENERPINPQLDYVTYGYRSSPDIQKTFGSSGACLKNVNCPEGLAYSNNRDGVVLLLNGTNTFCTGALVANVNYDGKPYILTANHCFMSQPVNWVFRFNYQSQDCANPASEPTSFSVSGAELRARNSASDFCLVEITGGLIQGQLPDETNAYFNGWDYSGVNLTSAVGIHHPRGDIKKISFEDDIVLPATSTISGVTSQGNGVWKINWDRGTSTENKSSGSPLFDSNKRLVGQLWGGSSSCTNAAGFDFYGRFFFSWDLEDASDRQLKVWLDPTGISTGVIDGHRLGHGLAAKELSLSMTAQEPFCSKADSLILVAHNVGQNAVSNYTVQYTFDNWATSNSIIVNTALPVFEAKEIKIPLLTSPINGWNTFESKVSVIDGVTNPNATNSSVSQRVFVPTSTSEVQLKIYYDCYASETSWTIVDELGTLFYRGPNLQNTIDKGLKTFDFCLPDGCYVFKITDSHGDGMSYSNPDLQCEPGHFTLTSNGFTLVNYLAEDTSFKYTWQKDFCIGPLSVDDISQQFSIYPNPVQHQVSIKSDTSFDSYRLISLDGRVVQEARIETEGEVSIPISATSGCYLLELLTNNQRVHLSKLVVE